MIVQGNSILRALLQSSKCMVPARSNNVARAMSSGLPSEDLVFQESGNAGVIILNRSKGHNAINLCMMFAATRMIEEFEKHKKLILVKSSVPKTFSVGGDVVQVLSKLKHNDKTLMYSMRYGYQLIHTIGTARIPCVTLVDGICMGGGAGISSVSKYSIHTENSDFAMPEARIGVFCDVGSSYYLSRLKNHVGFYLALTGTRVRGYDNVHVGTATHFCESSRLPELEKALAVATTDDLDGVLDSVCKKSDGAAAYSLEPHIEKIDRIFRLHSVEDIIAQLEEDGSAWAKKTAATIRCMCPFALKAVLYNLHLSKDRSLGECLQNEFILAHSFFFFKSENFQEGVRAVLIDKDNKPNWVPKRLEDVTTQMIEDLYNVPTRLGPLQLRPSLAK